jgi:hypothetical protein
LPKTVELLDKLHANFVAENIKERAPALAWLVIDQRRRAKGEQAAPMEEWQMRFASYWNTWKVKGVIVEELEMIVGKDKALRQHALESIGSEVENLDNSTLDHFLERKHAHQFFMRLGVKGEQDLKREATLCWTLYLNGLEHCACRHYLSTSHLTA